MRVKKDLREYVKQIFEIYVNVFKNSRDCFTYDFENLINLENSYGLFKDNELISFVGVIDRKVIDTKREYNVALLTIMIKSSYLDNNIIISFINEIKNELVNKYDSVCTQYNNYEITKNLDLITTTLKIKCSFIKGEYPTPMIMNWNDPNPNIILDIESNSDTNKIGVLRKLEDIESNIKLNLKRGLKFIANPFAYVWFDDKTKTISEFMYTSVSQLCWLFNIIQPNGDFLLFDDSDLKDISSLNVFKDKIIKTRTFKKSKFVLKNIKFIDYIR